MPYKADKQRKFFNATRGVKVPTKVVDEFNKAERYKRKAKHLLRRKK